MSDDYLAHRALILRLAYDVTGSWADAEDVAQTVYVRWQTAGAVERPRAYLARMAVNAALDVVARRDYTGPELPGPVPTGPGADAAVERAAEVELALALVLQSLSPLERAAFLLHDIFDFSHTEIAEMLDRSPAAVRQLGSRARKQVHSGRARFEASPSQVTELAGRFFVAATTGDLDGLLALLTEDVTLVSDGGGRVSAARRPVVGAADVAAFVLGVARKGGEGYTIEAATLNDQPSWVLRDATGRPDVALWLRVEDGLITDLYLVRDPRKLSALAAGRTAV